MTNQERYQSALLKMQSGVAMDQNFHPERPKDSRVGINNALSLLGSLSRLLVVKGVISDDEYWAAAAEGMEAEVANYEYELSVRLGKKVTLGEAGSLNENRNAENLDS